MASNVDHCISRFKKVVTQLVSVRRIKESDCDAIIQEYTSFLDNIPAFGSEKFSNFNFSTDRLDEAFQHLHEYTSLPEVVESSTAPFSPVSWSSFSGKRFLGE